MRALVFSSPGGRVASICEKGDRLQIAWLPRMTQCTITPSSYSQTLCVCKWEGGWGGWCHEVECYSWLFVALTVKGGCVGALESLSWPNMVASSWRSKQDVGAEEHVEADVGKTDRIMSWEQERGFDATTKLKTRLASGLSKPWFLGNYTPHTPN